MYEAHNVDLQKKVNSKFESIEKLEDREVLLRGFGAVTTNGLLGSLAAAGTAFTVMPGPLLITCLGRSLLRVLGLVLPSIMKRKELFLEGRHLMLLRLEFVGDLIILDIRQSLNLS